MVLNFSLPPLQHLGFLMIYLMPRWTKEHKTASGFGVPRRPGDAVAVTAAPSRFPYLGIPLHHQSYMNVNIQMEPVIIATHSYIHTRLKFLIPRSQHENDERLSKKKW